MAVPIAELFISVSADVNAAISGLNALGNKLNSTTSQFQRAAPAALLLAGAGTAIGTGFVGAIKTAADFEKQMSGVRAVMTPKEIQQFGGALDELALSLGEQTSFSALQAAAGIEELIKAGVPAAAVLEGAGKAALDLAAATGTSVPEAATIAAQAMNAFKVPVSELPTIVDRLAGVVNVTAADMSDLRFGLQSVGAVAAVVGLSFTDTVTALGLFANSGLRGQDAGTSLKTMLINLTPSTKAQTAEFKRLGLITADGSNAFFDATGKAKNLAGIAGTLKKALAGMTEQQKLATLQTLFGTDALRAAAILASAGADGVNELTGQIAQISAADQAAERLNNFAGQLEQLGGAIQTVAIRIGRLFLPELTRLTILARTMVKAFSALTPQQQRLIALFTAGAGAAALLVGSFVLLAPAIVAVGPAFGALAGILAGLSVPFLLLAGAAALLVLAWRRDFGGIRELAGNALAALPGILDTVRTDVAKLADLWQSRLMPALRPVGEFVTNRLVPAFLDLVDPLKNVNVEVDKLSVQFEKANTFLREHSAQIALIAGAITGAVAGFLAFQSAMSTINGVLLIGRAVVTAFTVAFSLLTLVMAANPFLLAAIAIGAIAGALIAAYLTNEDFRASVDGLLATLAPLGDAIGGAFGVLGAFIAEHGPPILEFLNNLGGVALAELGRQGASLQPFIEALGNFFSALGNFVSAVAERAGPALQGFFQNILVPGFEALGETLAKLLPFVQPILDFLASLGITLPTIGDALKPFTLLLDAWSAGLNAVADAIRNLPPLPDWLTPNSGANVFGNRPPQPAGGPQVTPTAFGFGGAGGGNLISITVNSGPITGEADEQRLAETIAAAINGSARRVNPPPDNSGNPQLVRSFA